MGLKGDGAQCAPIPATMSTCMECGRDFTTKRGLAVHSRTAHAKAHNSELTASIGTAIGAQTKRRWDEEEVVGMAIEEARLRRRRVKTINAGRGKATVNVALAGLIPGRTFEAIKSRRKCPKYKRLVESYMSASPDKTRVPQRQRGITETSICGEVQVSPPSSGGTAVVPDVPDEDNSVQVSPTTTGGTMVVPDNEANAVQVSQTTTGGTKEVPSGEISAQEATTPRGTARAVGGAAVSFARARSRRDIGPGGDYPSLSNGSFRERLTGARVTFSWRSHRGVGRNNSHPQDRTGQPELSRGRRTRLASASPCGHNRASERGRRLSRAT